MLDMVLIIGKSVDWFLYDVKHWSLMVKNNDELLDLVNYR